MKVLVIGGTGPTGPFVVNGFLERGYDVSILNRGSHHTDEIPASVERILGDPHFGETLRSALSCLLYTSPSPRDVEESRMPSSA